MSEAKDRAVERSKETHDKKQDMQPPQYDLYGLEVSRAPMERTPGGGEGREEDVTDPEGPNDAGHTPREPVCESGKKTSTSNSRAPNAW